ncbi:hypothetical protein CVIRNUC_002456 [Coccomyxa viridis]|uniref:Large ribosomal subunit protein uL29c n=1 Tax=Coccomyxa viridis TaxID=1274662 RepID=A0AAV1I051_9CHLO|nr:hypothetical protein CVIRNUC_002456 [Coccomyxa viridis]
MMSLSGSLACSHSCYMRSSPSQPLLRSRAIARPLCRSTPPTVAAAEASEKRQATKASEFQGMGAEKIDEEVQKSKRALFDLRIAQRTKQPFKPSDFWYNKKKIAQLLTVRRQQEIEQGIAKRESRSIERKKLLAAGFGNLIH